MSLSWGTGQMAAELALSHGERRVAVLGSGVVGLTSARQLQRRGFTVTIYAATVPPDTTSNMSLAGFTPTSGLLSFDRRTAAWEEQFRRALARAPNNGWSYYGLIELYKARGDGDGVRRTQAELAKTWVGDRALLQMSKL